MAKVKEHKKSFGQSIKAYRESRKLSIKDLAHETGYPADLLEKVEKDETTAPVASFLQLSRTLKVDVAALDGDEKQKASSRVKVARKSAQAPTPHAVDQTGSISIWARIVTIEPNTATKAWNTTTKGRVRLCLKGKAFHLSAGTPAFGTGPVHSLHPALHHALSNPSRQNGTSRRSVYSLKEKRWPLKSQANRK